MTTGCPLPRLSRLRADLARLQTGHGVHLVAGLLLAAAGALVVAGVAGCHPVNVRDDLLNYPVPPAMMPPKELAKVSLPTYRIEPPDVLAIEMLKLVPLPPYRAEVYDTLQIHVSNALADQPIDNYFMVEAEGVVNLGPAYGSVRVVGMTIDEMKKAIEAKLGQIIREPEVSVQLARVSGAQPVTGQYLVGPDGNDQPAPVRRGARGGHDGDRGPAGHPEAPEPVPRLARVVGGRGGLQQQGVLRDHARGGAGRQRAAASRSPATRRCWTRSAR